MSGTETVGTRSGRPPSGEAVLSRAFRIMRAFRATGERLPLHVLATRAGLPKSSTSRISGQLVDLGALERDDDGNFAVGLHLLEIASLAPRGHGLRTAALPVMEDLHHVTRQHVLLAVRDGEDGVLIERLSAEDATAVLYRVGGRIPLHQTGIGVALLMNAPDQIVQASVARAADPGALRRTLASARSEGVCAVTAPNPLRGGPASISTVAAPVVDRLGQGLGAISIVTPSDRAAYVAHKVAVRAAALAISRGMAAYGFTRGPAQPDLR
nr:IclR family transcriptional regulator [Gordonia sp. LAM0048]